MNYTFTVRFLNSNHVGCPTVEKEFDCPMPPFVGLQIRLGDAESPMMQVRFIELIEGKIYCWCNMHEGYDIWDSAESFMEAVTAIGFRATDRE